MNLEKTLDRLIAVSVDSQKRYHHAALDVGKEYLAEFFNQQSTLRKSHADELEAERDKLGKHKREAGSIRGMLDTVAMEINVIHSMGDTGVVDWCRKDAEAAAKEYQQELAQNPPPHIRAILERQTHDILAAVGALEKVLQIYGGPRS